MKQIFAVILAVHVCAISSVAQGFINLNFEAANLSAVPAGQSGGMVSVSSGLPGWQVFLGTNQQTQIFHNDLSAGAATVDILGPSWSFPSPGFQIIEGSFTPVLQAGQASGDVAATLTQTGLVPLGSQSIQIKFGVGASEFEVSLGGQNISMLPLLIGANYTLYGGNLPFAYAGQVEQLSISALSDSPNNTFNSFTLDSIVFSTNSVPEPSTWALILCGAGLLTVGWVIGNRKSDSPLPRFPTKQ